MFLSFPTTCLYEAKFFPCTSAKTKYCGRLDAEADMESNCLLLSYTVTTYAKLLTLLLFFFVFEILVLFQKLYNLC